MYKFWKMLSNLQWLVLWLLWYFPWYVEWLSISTDIWWMNPFRYGRQKCVKAQAEFNVTQTVVDIMTFDWLGRNEWEEWIGWGIVWHQRAVLTLEGVIWRKRQYQDLLIEQSFQQQNSPERCGAEMNELSEVTFLHWVHLNGRCLWFLCCHMWFTRLHFATNCFLQMSQE